MGELDNIVQRLFYSLTGGVPVLLVSGTLFYLWARPMGIEGGQFVCAGASLIWLEFVLLHSGAFMSVGPTFLHKWWQQALWFFGFALFYGGAFFGFVKMTQSDYILWIVISVLVSRLITVLIMRDKRGTILALQRSVLGIVVFLFTAIICILPVPEWGLTDAVVSKAFSGRDAGVIEKYPERFVVWGAVYFLLIALMEFYAGWYMPFWTDEEVEKTWKALGRKPD